MVRYGLNTLPNPVWFGTNSIPVPDTSVSSVQLQYRFRRLGKFDTTSTPVSDTSVSSVRPPNRPRVSYRYTLPDIPLKHFEPKQGHEKHHNTPARIHPRMQASTHAHAHTFKQTNNRAVSLHPYTMAEEHSPYDCSKGACLLYTSDAADE